MVFGGKSKMFPVFFEIFLKRKKFGEFCPRTIQKNLPANHTKKGNILDLRVFPVFVRLSRAIKTSGGF